MRIHMVTLTGILVVIFLLLASVNAPHGTLPFAQEGGLPPVAGPHLDLDDRMASATGVPVTFTVSITNAPNEVGALGFDITFDANVLQFDSFTAAPLVGNWPFFDLSQPASGTLRIGGFTNITTDRIATGASGTLVQLQFTVLGAADTTLTITNPVDDIATWTLGEGRFTFVTCSDDSGALNIRNTVGAAGSVADVEVVMQAAPNLVDAFGFEVAFDAAKLSFDGFKRGNLTTGFDFFDISNPRPGVIRIGGFEAGAETIAMGSSGTVVTLHFTVAAGVPLQDTLLLRLQNLTDAAAAWPASHGCITIGTGCLLNGDVNQDGLLTPADALCIFRWYLGLSSCLD